MSESLKTSLFTVLPTLGMLRASKKYMDGLGCTFGLSSVNAKQQEFLAFFASKIDESNLPEINSMADEDISKVNEWIKQQGFDIQLGDNAGPGFAVAAIMRLILNWKEEGTDSSIGNWRAAKLSKGYSLSHNAEFHNHPVIRINCKNGDVACMSIWGQPLDSNEKFLLAVSKLRNVKEPIFVDTVKFPCISLDTQEDYDWIKGLRAGSGFRITECKSQTKLKIDEFGAVVESCSAVFMYRGGRFGKNYVIDKPFLFWVERKGVSLPLFAAFLCEDVWVVKTGNG